MEWIHTPLVLLNRDPSLMTHEELFILTRRFEVEVEEEQQYDATKED